MHACHIDRQEIKREIAKMIELIDDVRQICCFEDTIYHGDFGGDVVQKVSYN